METNSESVPITPPKIVPSIISGLNTVTNHIGIILLPILLDLFLWLGPRFNLKKLLMPSIASTLDILKNQNLRDLNNMILMAKETWDLLLDRFNLATALRTYPIGVPSLISVESPIHTPFGTSQIYNITDLKSAVFLWFLFTIVGLMAGCVYFYNLARITSSSPIQLSIRNLMWYLLQVIGFTFFLIIFLLIFSIPLSFILSIFTILHPVVSQLATVILSLILLWLLMPLIFTPHGIFANRLNFLSAVLVSTRMVRMTMPATVFFILFLIILSQGLDILWRLAPETSWFKFIGIAGHAFISTGVIAASFVYYNESNKWIESYINSFRQSEKQQVI